MKPDNSSAAGPVVVFLGPSLRADEARDTLRAQYLGPVRCGDILRIRRMKPRAIGIIDGLFESTSAVWHKEILLAIEDGIAVFGASSMGALRAAELAAFGMVGLGKIFEAYRDGVYTDDDEVALLHAPAAFGYAPLSEAMVNIRATVDSAIAAGVISPESGDRVIRCAKDTFYQERSIAAAIEHAWRGADGEEADRFRRFIDRGGYVNQKHLDALALVRHLTRLPSRPSGEEGSAPRVHRSYFIRRLQYEVACESVESADDPLPLEERVAYEARALGATYCLLRRLAQLLSAAHALAAAQGLTAAPPDVQRVYEDDDFGLGPAGRTTRWARAVDLDAAGHAALVRRLSVIRALVSGFQRRFGPRETKRRHEVSLLALMRIDGRYGSARPRGRQTGAGLDRAVVRNLTGQNAVDFRLYRRTATLWSVLDASVEQVGIAPVDPLQVRSDEFRRARGLDRRAAALAWQRLNNIDHRQYVDLLGVDSRLSAVCDGSHAYWLGLLDDRGPAFDLLDAIRLAGLYPALKRRARRGVDSTLTPAPFRTSSCASCPPPSTRRPV